jgi:hypothetical protein
MRRGLLKLASIISLILCAATIVIWISTYFWSIHYAGYIVRQSADEFHPFFEYVTTRRGEITIAAGWYHGPLKNRSAADQQQVDTFRRFATINRPRFQWLAPWNYDSTTGSLLGMAGFECWRRPIVRGVLAGTNMGCSLPLWSLVMLFGLIPAARPARRIITAVRHAPPAPKSAHRKRDRALTALAMTACVLFVLIQIIIHDTRTIGWSVRFARPGGTFVEFAAQRRKLYLTLLSHWPQPQPLAFIHRPDDEYRPLYPYWEAMPNVHADGFMGLTWIVGGVPFHTEDNGEIALLPYGRTLNRYWSASNPFPYRQYQVSLFELGLLASVIPVWWVFTRVRKRVRAYTAARDSLCVGCGYSLAGNMSGVCPECGSAIAAM